MSPVNMVSKHFKSLKFLCLLLHRYRDFRRSLLQVHGDTPTDAARNAAEALVSVCLPPFIIMKNNIRLIKKIHFVCV